MTCAHWCTTYVIGRRTCSLLSCLVSSTSALGRIAGLPWWRLRSRKLEEVDLRWLWSRRLWLEFPPGQNFLSTKPLPYLVSQYSNTASVSCLSCPLEKVSPEQPSKVHNGWFFHRFAGRLFFLDHHHVQCA
ncbi:hypothetical protein BDV33DRAFT_3595 [Aspergillus novoparasiticus]|uniref:Uncharacterized protein n=1 Tax=Aspergillus novoparasiticus TaxID=986946 RepID=A0A5N6FC21_9EURO|nr:hypothetical protein BDV33DRAFT_3595 [Aspergillus novoparasiticus]